VLDAQLRCLRHGVGLSVTDYPALRSELEAQEKTRLQRKVELQAHIESLWRKATLNSLPVETDTRRRKFKV
jgi:hypothetical protein